MKSGKNNDPFWWTLFGGGGTLSAFFMPVLVILLGIAIPLGWLPSPGYESMYELVSHPISRIILFALISLSLFHWAHRFRYTMYDGLQLKHLEHYIMVICYGSAIIGTIITAILVISL